MKIPDEYASGSRPLEGDRELIALGLVSFSIMLADETLKDNSFLENLRLHDLKTKERNRILLELITFNLFAASRWMLGNFKDNTPEILDRMFYHFQKAVSGNDVNFASLIDERFQTYSEDLKNMKPDGSGFGVGKTAVQYILGREDIQKLLDMEHLMKSIYMFNQMMLDTVDVMKKMIETRAYKNLK